MTGPDDITAANREFDALSRVWFVTGSSRGLGRAIADAVLAAGHRLMATARDPTKLDDLLARYRGRVRAVALDVTNATNVAAAVDATITAFGRLDVVVNVAGYGDIGSIEDTSLADFRAQIETNLFGVIDVTKAAIPVMREQRSGHIIQFSSVGGRIGSTGRAPYGAAARFQREYDGHQPGDPAKAASVILAIVEMTEPPLRLLLGSDAIAIVDAADLRRTAADRKWRDLSISTDYVTAPQP